jgi:hypothetical protein
MTETFVEIETTVQPEERTPEQKKWDIRFEKLKAKWLAASIERERVHNLKPAQERFYYAVTVGQSEKVDAFLKSGEIDVNATCGGRCSPLQRATMNGNLKIVESIIVNGGNVSYVNQSGHTALLLALMYGNHKRYENIVSTLLLHGADVNGVGRDNRTAIHYAVMYASSAVVKILLDHGADISMQDDTGKNALHALIFRQSRSVSVQSKICRLLLEHGSDIRFKLQTLRAYDHGSFDLDDSDSEDDVPAFTPADLADLMEKPELFEIMEKTELLCAQQVRQASEAKLAREELSRRQMKLALAMGQHARLGVDSSIMSLAPDILHMIAKNI